MAPPNPTRFGKYELLSRLAKGGMAETFRARLIGAAGVSRPVVIKKVLSHLAKNEDFIAAFIVEAKVSASLSHGNIAQVFDFGRVDDDYFIAMELVDGRSLAEVLDRAAARGFARIPPPIACFLAIEVLKGLHYAHTRLGEGGQPLSLVHRDVSPENVLVSFEGQTKLVDFGVAKAALRGRSETEPGVVKGKFLYFSPEQACAEPLDGRSDVFAVGVVLYRMLCGVLPFEGQMHNVMRAIVAGRFAPPAVVNPQLPSALAAIVTRAMATDRAKRHESALEIQEALSGFLYRQEPSFSGESIKEWMRWLFRPELEAERRDIALSSRFLAQLQKWEPSKPAPEASGAPVTRDARAVAPPGTARRALPWVAVALIALAVATIAFVAAGPVAPIARVVEPGPLISVAPASQQEPSLPAVAGPPPVVPAAPLALMTAAQRKERLAAGRQAIDELDWAKAQQILETCVVGTALCPEATALLAQMPRERDSKNAILNAERALDAADLSGAALEMAKVGNPKLLAKRQRALSKRWAEATINHGAAMGTVADGAHLLLLEAKQEMSNQGYAEARPLLERCLRLEPKNAECHKFLAAVWGKLGNSNKRLRYYKEFMKLAPANHPERSAIQEILDAEPKSKSK